MEDLTFEQQQQVAAWLIGYLRTHPTAAYLLIFCTFAGVVMFIFGVSTDFIAEDKITSIRGKALYRLAKRFGLFFRGIGVDLYEAATNKPKELRS